MSARGEEPRASGLPKPLAVPLGRFGHLFVGFFAGFGGIAMMSWQIVRRLVPPRIDGPELMRNLYGVGVKSFPIIVVTALLVGAIMVLQAGIYVERYGAEGLIGWGAGFAIVREVSPLLIALMFNGRVGAKNTAEIGTMKVTEQVDALRALAIDPISYLVMPRFISMVVMLTVLVVVGDATAIGGGILTAQLLLGVDPRIFMWSFLELVTVEDFMLGIYKAFTFGIAIGVISSHFGITVGGGAVGVGRAVNNSVVASAVAIFLLNYIVTYTLV